MRPEVAIIVHTDWAAPDPDWPHQPRLPFNRDNSDSWDAIFRDLGDVAKVDIVAIGCRGTFDPGAVGCLPMARSAYRRARTQPAVTFWADTVGLPDITHNLDGGPFDFANDEHIEWAWTHYVKHFVDHFGDLKLARSPHGKVLIFWWGISNPNGHGFVNQHLAQRLLDYIDLRLSEMGLGGADHIVDRTWIDEAPNLRVFGVHNWFDGGQETPKSFTIRPHHGITTGVVVPGFYNPTTKVQTIPHSSETARLGLQATRHCDYQLLEGATDYTEDAHWVIDSAGDDSKLKAIREITEPHTEEDSMPAAATFAISQRESFDHPTKPGSRVTWHPKGQRETILSVQGNGDISTRILNAPPAPPGVPFDHTVHGLGGVPGAWETWEPQGNRAVFPETAEYYAIPLVD